MEQDLEAAQRQLVQVCFIYVMRIFLITSILQAAEPDIAEKDREVCFIALRYKTGDIRWVAIIFLFAAHRACHIRGIDGSAACTCCEGG